MNIRALYIGDGPNAPFHWGRAVNAGMEASRGQVISVMDGDLLLEGDFLQKLDNEHATGRVSVLNLHRRMVPRPIGVPRTRWTEQQIDFAACLASCPDRDDPLPDRPNNYGPMISARREHWNAINGYDDHPIWGSGLSLLGTDATRRLEIRTGVESRLLPGTVCVHPWHPVGFQRTTLGARRILSLQETLVKWAVEHQAGDWKERRPFARLLYDQNRKFVNRVMRSPVAYPSSMPTPTRRMVAWLSASTVRLARGEFRELRKDVEQALRATFVRD
jgi:hypothetical protein